MKKIIVYHGTAFDFENIDLNKLKNRRDFGKGFYTTTIQAQAEAWAKNIALRNNSSTAYVYVYEFTFAEELNFKVFDGLTAEWLEFIKDNRTLGDVQHSFDVVVGPVADDNTMLTVNRYMNGTYTTQEALERLAYFRVNDQLCINTEKALKYIKLVRRYEVD